MLPLEHVLRRRAMIKRSLLFLLFASLLVPAVSSGQPEVKVPLLKKAIWQRPLNLDKDLEEENEKTAKATVERALATVGNGPIVPGFFPLAASLQGWYGTFGKIVVYRTYSDVRSLFLVSEKDKQGKVSNRAGDIYFKGTPLDGSLAVILNHKELRPTIEGWLNRTFAKQPKSTNFLYENTLLGRVTSSRGLVYSVDDLAIPAPQASMHWAWQWGKIPLKVKQYVLGNSLQAFELDTGKFRWRLGSDPENDRPLAGEFSNSHFLGSPLPVGERLYVLNEKNKGDKRKKGGKSADGEGELRLVCIDPKKLDGEWRPKVIPPLLSLGKVPEHLRITHDPVRRISSVELVHQNGVLICPTHAGKVFGVDLKKMATLWTYRYQERKKKIPVYDPEFDQDPIEFIREWRIPAIFPHKGRLVFAAPDDGSVHCIRIKDGKPLWKAPRKDGLYVAGVFGDKVVVVGAKTCWALGTDDGKMKWTIDTGVPSGKGTAQGNIYYLPLRKSASSAKPGISLVDIAKGKVLQTVDSPEGELPGNLLIHQDMLISQSATSIAAYPLGAGKK
jgi:putative pyrroloquinoline-quinone binding quinoprotein